MTVSSANRTALFIDGANLYSTAKALGFDIDYKRLLKEFQSHGTLVRAFYYTAVTEDQEFSSVRPLLDWLDYSPRHLRVQEPGPIRHASGLLLDRRPRSRTGNRSPVGIRKGRPAGVESACRRLAFRQVQPDQPEGRRFAPH